MSAATAFRLSLVEATAELWGSLGAVQQLSCHPRATAAAVAMGCWWQVELPPAHFRSGSSRREHALPLRTVAR